MDSCVWTFIAWMFVAGILIQGGYALDHLSGIKKALVSLASRMDKSQVAPSASDDDDEVDDDDDATEIESSTGGQNNAAGWADLRKSVYEIQNELAAVREQRDNLQRLSISLETETKRLMTEVLEKEETTRLMGVRIRDLVSENAQLSRQLDTAANTPASPTPNIGDVAKTSKDLKG